MKFLVDTCVVSELCNRKPNALVCKFIAAQPDEALHLSVLTLGELARGIALLPKGRRRTELQEWFSVLESGYSERLVGVDASTCKLWGEVDAAAKRRGATIPIVDGLIAASALRHGMTVVTRNVEHFSASGAPVLDPWTAEERFPTRPVP